MRIFVLSCLMLLTGCAGAPAVEAWAMHRMDVTGALFQAAGQVEAVEAELRSGVPLVALAGALLSVQQARANVARHGLLQNGALVEAAGYSVLGMSLAHCESRLEALQGWGRDAVMAGVHGVQTIDPAEALVRDLRLACVLPIQLGVGAVLVS